MNIAIVVTLFGMVGGGIAATIKMVANLSGKWGALEERVKNIASDVTELKENQDKLIWERGLSAVQHSTGRR